MEAYCESCHDYTEQKLLKVEASSSDPEMLLTTYQCHTCHKENYGTAKKSKFDNTKYPIKPLIPPENLEDAIRANRNWKPPKLAFKIENNKYFVGEIHNGEISYDKVSKEEYDEEKFQHQFQLKYFNAKRGETITYWEYPPKNYEINEDCEVFGHEMEYIIEYEDKYGLETYPEYVDAPDMLFVGRKMGACNVCGWRDVTVYPDKLRQWYFQKEMS